MNTEHTQGMLQIHDRQPTFIRANNGKKHVASTEGFGDEEANKANARRIVACWNACAGLQTEFIEGRRFADLEISMELQDERDELLAALELAEGVAQRVIAATGFDERQVSDWRPVVRSAIARAKGGAA